MSIIKRKFNESNRLTLFNGDCSELLKSIPSNSVDLIITSPPYCIGKAYEDPHDDIKTFKKQHEDIFEVIYKYDLELLPDDIDSVLCSLYHRLNEAL